METSVKSSISKSSCPFLYKPCDVVPNFWLNVTWIFLMLVWDLALIPVVAAPIAIIDLFSYSSHSSFCPIIVFAPQTLNKCKLFPTLI